MDHERTFIKEIVKLFNYRIYGVKLTFVCVHLFEKKPNGFHCLKETPAQVPHRWACLKASTVKDNRASGIKDAVVVAANSAALLRWNAVSASIVHTKGAFFGLVCRPLSRSLSGVDSSAALEIQRR